MRDLLPPFVICEEALAADSTAPLNPLEEAYWLGRAVAPKRWSELRAGRACARRALAGLGIHGYPLLPGPRREPLWPLGVVGSITHCEGYCAAAVADSRKILGLGIDAEPHRTFPLDLADQVSSTAELEAASAAVGSGLVASCLIFSAKESVYKALYPATGEFLDFRDLVLTVGRGGDFTVERVEAEAGHRMRSRIEGRYRVGAHLVLTVAILNA